MGNSGKGKIFKQDIVPGSNPSVRILVGGGKKEFEVLIAKSAEQKSGHGNVPR